LSVSASVYASVFNNSITSEKRSRAREGNGSDEGFKTFWDLYPKKVGQPACRRWWQDNRPDAELSAKIYQSIEQHKAWPDWIRKQGRYIPNPIRFLMEGRWQDEAPEDLEAKDIERRMQKWQ